MSQLGGRRIMRSYEVSLSNIRPCTPEYLEGMKNEFDLLHDYIIKKQEQKTAGKEVNTKMVRTLAPPNTDYLCKYISFHPTKIG